MDYKLEAMCLAATHIDAMRDFYAGVFGVDFTADDIGEGRQMYTGQYAGLAFTLVPAEAMQAETGANPTHYDIYIPDLEEGIALVEQHGGKTNNRIGEDEHERAIGVFDPDGNFMVFKQRKTGA